MFIVQTSNFYQNEFGLYNLTKKMCSSTLTSPPPWKSSGNPHKKNSMDHRISYKSAIFRRPLHSKGSLYISRCVCVCSVCPVIWIFFQRGLVRNKKNKSAANNFNNDEGGRGYLEAFTHKQDRRRSGTAENTKLSITRSFFELETPNFA